MVKIMEKEFLTIDGLQLSLWDRDYIEKLQQGNVDCVSVCTCIWENARDTLSTLGKWNQFIKENDDLLMQVQSANDIWIAKQTGKIGVLFGTQNSSLYESDLSLVAVFEQLGVKMVQLTYNIGNNVGGGYLEDSTSGLTTFGKQVVKEMNRHGVIVDVSHSSDQTILDAIEASDRPVAISHANPEWIFAAKRNKSKEILSELRDSNGFLGVCIYPNVLNGTNTSLDEFCDMIIEMIDFMGIDKVGIGTGSTYNYTNEDLNYLRMGNWTYEVNYGAGSPDNPRLPEWPAWFNSPADFPNIIKGLHEKGVSEEGIYAIMGGNWFRFFIDGFKHE